MKKIPKTKYEKMAFDRFKDEMSSVNQKEGYPPIEWDLDGIVFAPGELDVEDEMLRFLTDTPKATADETIRHFAKITQPNKYIYYDEDELSKEEYTEE